MENKDIITKRPMELRDTAEMMQSEDYKERFKAEYLQLKIRYQKLDAMLAGYKSGLLDFTPTCSISILDEQRTVMAEYIAVLEVRASLEGIDLSNIKNSAKPSESEWISIDNELPSDGVIVLITDGNKSDVGFYDEGSNTFVSDYDFCDDNCVTHWMPLPDPRCQRKR